MLIKKVLIHGTPLFLEVVALQISTVLIGFLRNDDILGAHSSALNIVFNMDSIFVGIGVGLSQVITRSVGERSGDKAKTYTIVGIIISFLLCIGFFGTLIALRP